MGSFSTIKGRNDPHLATTCYCMTDGACGHFEAYSEYLVVLVKVVAEQWWWHWCRRL